MSKDWYARKLAGEPAPRTVAPPPPALPSWPPTSPAAPSAYQAPAPTTSTPTRASSSRLTDYCPECTSTNYMSPPGHSNIAKRCYDCGYPIVHSTSGMSIPSDGKPATPVRQVQGSGFNPQVIVGRIE